MFTTYIRFCKIGILASIIMIIALLAFVDSASAYHRSSFGAFAPDGSLTLPVSSNTNLVQAVHNNEGFKGAYGLYGILLPDDNKHDQSDNDQDTPIIVNPPTVQPPAVNPPIVNPPTNDPPKKSNPGNDKPVGNAGEKCNKGMCEDGDSGERGKGNAPKKQSVLGLGILILAKGKKRYIRNWEEIGLLNALLDPYYENDEHLREIVEDWLKNIDMSSTELTMMFNALIAMGDD